MITAYIEGKNEMLFCELNRLYVKQDRVTVENVELRFKPFYYSEHGKRLILKVEISTNESDFQDDALSNIVSDTFSNALARFFADVSFFGHTIQDNGGWGEIYTSYSVGYPVIQVDTVYSPELHDFGTTNMSKQWEDKDRLWDLLSEHDYFISEQDFNSMVRSYINSGVCSENLLACKKFQPRNEIMYEIFYHDCGYEFFNDYIRLDDSAYSEKYKEIERDQLILSKLRTFTLYEHDEPQGHRSDDFQHGCEVSDEPQA